MENQKQKRGQLTQRIKDYSKKALGYEIGVEELRLMVYVQYVMVNEQKLEMNKINGTERSILTEWRKAGHIEGGAGGLMITKEFWTIICSIIFLGYVDFN